MVSRSASVFDSLAGTRLDMVSASSSPADSSDTALWSLSPWPFGKARLPH